MTGLAQPNRVPSEGASLLTVSLEGVSVRLRDEPRAPASLRARVVDLVSMQSVGPGMRDVLRGVSFNIAPGELFAVVGANGAGKTTLLRVLAGIVPPSAGRVLVRGRIAPLIELGAGFDPDLSGRENLYLYGVLLGMELHALRDAYHSIVAFAQLETAMEKPLRHYSAGMAARLAFAVATASRPGLLLIDEVLAVGDEGFRSRCLERIARLRAEGCAVVLVSHDAAVVQALAERALWLEDGRPARIGDTREVMSAYRGGCR